MYDLFIVMNKAQCLIAVCFPLSSAAAPLSPPPSMPSKKNAAVSAPPADAAAAGASSAAGASPSVKRNYVLEEAAVLSWLCVPEHRNIVTGAAGSAQNGGGLSGSKCVTTKDAGWGMLAAHLNTTFRSSNLTFDKKQAQNKFMYLEKKYHQAKLWQQTSGVGVSDEDRARGRCLHSLLLCCIDIFRRY